MKIIQTFTACALLLFGFAHAAPGYNGTVKGKVDGKTIDVKTVCERNKIGKMDLLQVKSDPGMGSDLKDRNGDGVAVEIGVDMNQTTGSFKLLAGGREYKFAIWRELNQTVTGLTIKGSFSPATKEPQPDQAFDVDLTVVCP